MNENSSLDREVIVSWWSNLSLPGQNKSSWKKNSFSRFRKRCPFEKQPFYRWPISRPTCCSSRSVILNPGKRYFFTRLVVVSVVRSSSSRVTLAHLLLVALTQLSKLVPNLTIIATASSHKFDVLRAHIHYLFEHDIDYIDDVKK